MNTSIIYATTINKEEKKEQESIRAKVKANIAVVLPVFSENEESDIQIELDYDTITKVVDDYIGRYIIDPRIDEIEYELSIPKLPDEKATDNLKKVLTGETNKITTSESILQVDNKAIANDKVTLTFKLSVEENVYLDENADAEPQKQGVHQLENISQQYANSVPSAKLSQPINDQSEDELIIQSPNSQLFWQNDSSSQLYWQNAALNVSPQSNTSQYNNSLSTEETLDTIKTIGSGLKSGMDSTKTIEGPNLVSRIFKQKGGYVKVGDNGQVYTNPYARGNNYYKIAGDFSKNKYVKGLGIFGKVVNYGTTLYQTVIDSSQAETLQKKGRVWGASVGKVTSGTIAGAVASWVTSAILITIAGAAGVAAAPVTIVIIAGCSIMAGVAASNAVEQYGEDLGGNIGEEAIDLGQNVLNKTREELRKYEAKRIEERNGFRHSIKREK